VRALGVTAGLVTGPRYLEVAAVRGGYTQAWESWMARGKGVNPGLEVTMETTWILVADSARARLFTIDRPRGPLPETAGYADPQDRLRDQDLEADAPGRGAGSNGGRFAMGHEDGAKDHHAEQFARELAEVLDKSRSAGDLVRLYVMAAPNFLGSLRRFLDRATSGCIVESFPKDVVGERADAIRGHLPYRL